MDVMHELIRRHSLATLVTLGRDGLSANHIPMLIDPEPAPFGTLRGHVARSNAVWRDPNADVDTLAIFSGPESYISPSWYETKRETGKVVPTWNYVAVHAYGRLQIVEDVEWLRDLVSALTNVNEASFDHPWSITDAPADFIEAQLQGIVGIQMTIARLEGKWKVSQNRPVPDRRGVLEALESNEMSSLIRERMK